jgi:hypothetical protein
MLAMFVFFSILDVRHRKIKLFWFVGAAIIITLYKIFFEFSSFTSDGLMLAVSAILICVAYFTRLFGTADLFGMLLLSFAVPYVGPFPTGICVLVGTLILQNYMIIFSNIAYNISDIIQYNSLFDDVHQTKKHKVKTAYWFVMARRRRDNDRFVISAEKKTNDGSLVLSVKRNNKLLPGTKYVFSAHPQFVFSTVTFFILWFFSLGF